MSNPVGRPTVMDEATVAKLEDAFSKGCTVTEACLLSEISRNTYYDYIKENPAFSDKVETLKERVTLHARMNLAASIASGDLTDSKWYLERKKRDEFSLKQETEHSGKVDSNVQHTIAATPEQLESLKQYVIMKHGTDKAPV